MHPLRPRKCLAHLLAAPWPAGLRSPVFRGRGALRESRGRRLKQPRVTGGPPGLTVPLVGVRALTAIAWLEEQKPPKRAPRRAAVSLPGGPGLGCRRHGRASSTAFVDKGPGGGELQWRRRGRGREGRYGEAVCYSQSDIPGRWPQAVGAACEVPVRGCPRHSSRARGMGAPGCPFRTRRSSPSGPLPRGARRRAPGEFWLWRRCPPLCTRDAGGWARGQCYIQYLARPGAEPLPASAAPLSGASLRGAASRLLPPPWPRGRRDVPRPAPSVAGCLRAVGSRSRRHSMLGATTAEHHMPLRRLPYHCYTLRRRGCRPQATATTHAL